MHASYIIYHHKRAIRSELPYIFLGGIKMKSRGKTQPKNRQRDRDRMNKSDNAVANHHSIDKREASCMLPLKPNDSDFSQYEPVAARRVKGKWVYTFEVGGNKEEVTRAKVLSNDVLFGKMTNYMLKRVAKEVIKVEE